MNAWSVIAASVFSLACERTPEAAPAPAGPAKTAQAPASSVVAPATERPFRFAATGRIVAIGDLHGDLASTREALRVARVIDEQDHWNGGTATLVQTGDQLDRGDQEREILDLLERLGQEATKAGGALHVLNGNHEVMNVAGDMRYVTEGGSRQFAELGGRKAAFAPGGPYARKLAERDVAVIVGDTVFVHGGVLLKHVRYGLGRVNAEVSRWMRAAGPAPAAIQADDALVWTRAYGDPSPSREACDELGSVLAELKIKRMVVGHTVQKAGVSPACDARVFRIDIGLSDYYGENLTQVLEIDGERVGVLTAR